MLVGVAYFAGWAVIAVPVAYLGFMNDSRETVVAGHDATIVPTHDGYATINLGAFLPNARYPTDQRLGVRIDVGKTNLQDYDALIQRYALIASHPEGEIDKIGSLMREMIIDNALEGAAIGLVGPGLWLLIGARRRRDLWNALTPRRAAYVVAAVAIGVASLTVSEPWDDPRPPTNVASDTWEPIALLLPETTITGDAQRLQIQGGLTTSGTKQLLQSAFDTYDESVEFYRALADRAPSLAEELRQPEEGETVAMFVTDRHDNVGMDSVTRAIADAGGATVLFDGGDDTSSGESWEAFSLDSLAKAYDDYDAKYAVDGNHDNGTFVGDYLGDLGFTMLRGEPVKGADGIRLLGAPDPRSSGLGSWRTAVGITMDALGENLADTACASDEDGKRISTLLVHDADLGTESLQRGCVDLVLAGHLHVQVGPDQVTATNGSVGTTYTNGTSGGAAYAFALGSKLRRDAEVTLVTYRDGRPVGLQPVMITTSGEYDVAPFIDLPQQDQATAR